MVSASLPCGCDCGTMCTTLAPRTKGVLMTDNEARAFLISAILAPILFVIFAAVAYAQRGYLAFGGECAAFLLPAIVLFFVTKRHC